MKTQINIIDVSVENVSEVGVFCIKNKKSPGYTAKVEWFKSKINQGLSIKIAVDDAGKQLGFIEYTPSELAWRPIQADQYFFIQCIALFTKDSRQKNIGSTLIKMCEKEAKEKNKNGVCVMSSSGAWMANKTIFEKNGYTITEQKGRFELMSKKFSHTANDPKFNDWTEKQATYKGWNLIYSDQCPWHQKSVTDLKQTALDQGIELTIKRLTTPRQAQNAPAGFGTFALINDGKLLADHYISQTRFKNILKKELSQLP